MKKQVTQKALMARLNRRLAFRGEILKKCAAGSTWHKSLGDYYLVNVKSENIVGFNKDLVRLAREEGALQTWEVIEVMV